ncbi:hypothetical protein BJ322DRAFT_452260 [Thelephora terrestris]|uniref:F-box domain-containing protein n=1 Tax=Thelephora terrestris TaxID=56493 RepID=A0A9P6H4E5_9AGAM|nr:hypothetical protein BJ322DRAFT_452260 [Thelephora terrestris]
MQPPLHPPNDRTQASTSDENLPLSIMGRETNEDQIRELEKKIEEGAGDITQLKRARNSVLNISTRVPPEILGCIFIWRARDRGHLDRLRKSSYQFLFVCHRWYEVACHTPELWSFWGHTLTQWLRLYRRSGATPVDLVLNGHHIGGPGVNFNGPLRDAVRERARHDTIRSVQLWSERGPLVASVLSALTPDDEEIRYSSIESISLRLVDASEFFARCRFPRLSYLRLSIGTKISRWEHLGLHTTALTTLTLTFDTHGLANPPTAAQLLSIFSSNPRLQNITLIRLRALRDDVDRSTTPVPMHHLKKLTIDGDPRSTFQLVERLDFPEMMDELTLILCKCTSGDILGTLGPFVRDHIQRDGRLRDRLGIFVKCFPDSLSIQANAITTTGGQAQRTTFATFTANLRHNPPCRNDVQLCTDFVAYTPAEDIVYFGGDLTMDIVKRVVPTMPNIRELHLIHAQLEYGFLLQDPRGPLSQKKLLPSLERLYLEEVIYDDESWQLLLPYLAHQTSGGQRISLTISGTREHICKDVMKELKGFVEELVIDLDLDSDCPFDYCERSEEGEEEDG